VALSSSGLLSDLLTDSATQGASVSAEHKYIAHGITAFRRPRVAIGAIAVQNKKTIARGYAPN
jgi:hypothetical protein